MEDQSMGIHQELVGFARVRLCVASALCDQRRSQNRNNQRADVLQCSAMAGRASPCQPDAIDKKCFAGQARRYAQNTPLLISQHQGSGGLPGRSERADRCEPRLSPGFGGSLGNTAVAALRRQVAARRVGFRAELLLPLVLPRAPAYSDGFFLPELLP